MIKNKRAWKPIGAYPFFFAIMGVMCAFGLRLLLSDILQNRGALIFFGLNCLIIAYYWGFLPACFSMLISLPLVIYYFLYPYKTFDGVIDQHVGTLIIFSAICIGVSYIFELLNQERYQSQLLLRVSNSNFELLVESDIARSQLISLFNSSDEKIKADIVLFLK